MLEGLMGAGCKMRPLLTATHLWCLPAWRYACKALRFLNMTSGIVKTVISSNFWFSPVRVRDIGVCKSMQLGACQS